MNFRTPIQAELKRFDEAFPLAFSTKVPLMDLILRYAVKQKGKRLRPALVFLTAKAFSPAGVSDRAYRGATLVELMHTATLVHDDVVDDASTRRGAFSISALWKNKIAVLVGDYMLSRVLLLAVEHEDHDLLRWVSRAVKEVSEGELLQIEKARRLDIDEAVYDAIIQKKTASLMAACCAVGAATSDQPVDVIERAHAFGLALGMAFQIQDDLMDYQQYGQSGKPTGIDVKEQKMTLPLIHALSVASSSDKKALMRIVKNKKDDPASIQWLMEKVKDLGGLDYAQQRMADWQDRARQALSDFPDGDSREALYALVDYMGNRVR
ncbi:MAG TPA: polyprenyl synthetase [Cryomorphaceae bacterium]|jgi:octaprenyl-diphosphate synthase|nr:polyprenyl synthetase [Cryomorphaceae bacterium]HBJ70969.1 polyprenyl synthetase [Cryomorphaceae bacterium]